MYQYTDRNNICLRKGRYYNVRESMDALLTLRTTNRDRRVIRSCVKHSVYYAVVKVKYAATKTEMTYAQVCPVKVVPTPGDETYLLGFDLLSERENPKHHDFPVSWLNLLSETNDKYALAWREGVKKAHSAAYEKANTRDILNKLPLGSVVRLDNGEEVTKVRRPGYVRPVWRSAQDIHHIKYVLNHFGFIKEKGVAHGC